MYRFHKDRLVKCTEVSYSLGVNSRIYLFEPLLSVKSRSRIWDNLQMWEDAFFDSIAQERDIIGLDQAPLESMAHYQSLGPNERRQLELDEDRLLAVLLHNLFASMIMMRVDRAQLRAHIRRWQARCRLSLHYAQTVSRLLEAMPYLVVG
ncbi:unnamed protein product [Protopolystoma xenopodis]|uniref:MAP kinase-activating death domain-containing protein n=1 Tax=Protopolystoma xenopodis TaxID=117903 RepID=A0A3S4ZBX8_9PLAT|nr:unnamed protein product [Protopolystoma xenopodis]